MIDFIHAIVTQALLFVPLAFGISISYHVLRATDMTIDGSFVLGAAVFAKLVSLNFHPLIAFVAALTGGLLAGVLSATIQRNGKIDSLLAGVLATFILSSINLCVMGKPNISLLSKPTLVSFAFEKNEWFGWSLILLYVGLLCTCVLVLMKSQLGLKLRAFGDNPTLLKRLGHNIENYRIFGFAITNMLAAGSGCLTAQTIGYADVGMGLGMTLTGIGAIILGQQMLRRFANGLFRLRNEFFACLAGVVLYFFSLNILLRIGIDPIYLKMILGFMLIFFLRSAVKPKAEGLA